MSDFSIRSMEFKNAMKLPTSSSSQMYLVGINSDSRDFAKISPNDLIGQKLSADDGINIDYNNNDRSYHIGKDYTTRELNQLNLIDVYLKRITDSSCTSGQCTGYCIAVSTTITSQPVEVI